MDGLDLSNICAGSVPEVFERAVRELSKNLKDPNTEAEAKRKIVLEFSFKGYADRSGMESIFSMPHDLGTNPPSEGNHLCQPGRRW